MRRMQFRDKWREVTADGLLGKVCSPNDEGEEIPAAEVEPTEIVWGEKCPCCGASVSNPAYCGECGESFYRLKSAESGAEKACVAPPPPRAKAAPEARYKVITQRDEFFRGKFNPESLADLINEYAAGGWRVVGMTATDVGSFWGSFWSKGGGASRQELVILMEKQGT